MPRLRQLLLAAGVAVIAAAGAVAGCSARPEVITDGETEPPTTGPTASCDLAHPTPGCACTTADERVECGATKQIVEGNALCSIGTMICSGGTWGACEPERTVIRSLPTVFTQGLGSPGACADPCTPYCSTTLDTPAGLAVPSGLVTDAGLSLAAATPPPNNCTSIRISPRTAPSTDIVITSLSSTTTKTFTADLQPLGCNPSAPAPLWYTDKFDVAQMDANGKVSLLFPIAGPLAVSTALGTFSDTVLANVTVDVARAGTVNPPPSGATLAQFPAETGSETTDSTLEILYPYTATVFPLGLPAPLLQWRATTPAADGGVTVTLQYPATGTPIFRVTELVAEKTTAPVPLRAAQPRYAIPQSTWFAFEQTIHRSRATSGDTGRITVRRRIGGTTYAGKSIDVRFAPGQLKGRVYYNSYGTALVKNYSGAKQSSGGAFPGSSFGAATLVIPPGSTTPTVAAGFDGSGGCFVCHSASADGATLVTSDPNHVSTRYVFPGTAPNGGTSLGSWKFTFAGINPAATRMFTSSGTADGDSSSKLYTLSGAAVTSNAPAAMKGGYPSFATDGSAVAFTWRSGSGSPLSTTTTNGNALAMMSFDGNATFSGLRQLVSPSVPAAWPAFLPAGQNGIVYELETRTTPNGGFGFTRHDCECSTYSGATGELWWVSTGSSPVATRLHRANGYDAAGTAGALPVTPTTGHAGYGGTAGPAGAAFYEQNYNYEPSVLPQVIGGYSWIMFTSRRAYGNVATVNPYASDPRYDDISIDPTPKKLWMSALSASPTPGADPSAPSFYFPGQELIAGNSRAVFALEACHPAATSSAAATASNLCDTNLDCCGGSASPALATCVLDPPPLTSPPTKHCIASSGGACRATGESCLVTSNCCNATGGEVCASGVCTPPPSYYQPQSYARDYTASCTPGYQLRWGIFEWQSRTPSDSKVAFSAQQGDGTTFSPATPLGFATAQGADVVAPRWGTSGVKLSTVLGQPQTAPNKVLRITMALSPSSDRGQAPTLIDWRQSFECVPSE